MTRSSRRVTLVLVIGIVLAGCVSPPDTPRAPNESAPVTVFLVRHAEKTDQSRDPALSPAGVERAAVLAHTLRDAGIERIHSSDYARTRETAAPVAELLRVDVELYDPRDLRSFAELLRRDGGRHLVVGHSNTTPALVELLGGEPGDEIDEEREYDRLYVVSVGDDGTSDTVVLRYGARYVPGD